MEKSYKPSKFNYCIKNKKGELLIFNTYTGSLYKTTAEECNAIGGLLRQNTVQESDIPYDILKNAGYFLPDHADQNAMMNLLYLDRIKDNSLSLIILTTEHCNFRCAYCYEKFAHGAMPLSVQEDLIDYVKKNIHCYSSLNVSWFGGEPLLGLDVIRNLSKSFMEICAYNHKPYTAAMTTNAYLLTRDVYEELLGYKVTRYQITIDGLKETHDAQRVLANGKGTWDTIIGNLLEIKKVRRRGVQFMLRTNITVPIYEIFKEYINFLDESFGDDERFTVLLRYAGDWGGERVKAFHKNIIHSWHDVAKDVYQTLLEMDTQMDFGKLIRHIGPGYGVCYAHKRNNMSISPSGKMHKCTQWLEKNELTYFGEVKDYRSKYDIFEAAKWVMDFELNYKECETCYFLPVCFGAPCAVTKYLVKYGKMEKPTALPCPHEKVVIDQIMLLADKTQKFMYLK